MPLADPLGQVRPATLDDALAIAGVHVRSWKAAYPGLIPQDYLDGLRVEDRVGDWERGLSNPRSPGVYVYAEESKVVGFVYASPSRDPDSDPSVTGEVQLIYLDPDAYGRGVGELLMNRAESEMKAAGFADATLWVLDTNARARRFYERLGWHHDGTDKFHDWTAFAATDLRYRKRLGDPSE